MKNWNEHYTKQETITGWGGSFSSAPSEVNDAIDHVYLLKCEIVKLRSEFQWKKPWMWWDNYSKQEKLKYQIENHKIVFPEYHL